MYNTQNIREYSARNFRNDSTDPLIPGCHYKFPLPSVQKSNSLAIIFQFYLKTYNRQQSQTDHHHHHHITAILHSPYFPSNKHWLTSGRTNVPRSSCVVRVYESRSVNLKAGRHIAHSSSVQGVERPPVRGCS